MWMATSVTLLSEGRHAACLLRMVLQRAPPPAQLSAAPHSVASAECREKAGFECFMSLQLVSVCLSVCVLCVCVCCQLTGPGCRCVCVRC